MTRLIIILKLSNRSFHPTDAGCIIKSGECQLQGHTQTWVPSVALVVLGLSPCGIYFYELQFPNL